MTGGQLSQKPLVVSKAKHLIIGMSYYEALVLMSKSVHKCSWH